MKRIEITVVFECEVPDETDLASLTLLGEYEDFQVLDGHANWGRVVSFETVHEEIINKDLSDN